MSPVPTSLQSGLRTMTRKWSETTPEATNAKSQVSQSSAVRPAPAAKAAVDDARAKRLAAIQAALDEMSETTQALKTSKMANVDVPGMSSKRVSDVGVDEGPMKKKRILPESFSETKVTATASMTVTSTNGKPNSRSGSISATVMGITKQSKAERKAAEKPAAIFLSKEQQRVLELVEQKENLFYTGSAGTGKSVLLREIIKVLRKRYVTAPDAVAITASTGIAACNIGGVTLHSFAGCGLANDPPEQLIKKVRLNKKAFVRWQRTKVLIIDEVSMVDGEFFDKLNYIARKIRKKERPFGEIQVILTGDFFQLPPVTRGNAVPNFVFEAESWNEIIGDNLYNLEKVFRQKDQRFIDVLNEMRFGRMTQKTISLFKSLTREVHYDDGLAATELFPRREDVERSNNGRMAKLGTQTMTYRASDGGTIQDKNQREKMLANFMAPIEITLKVDAQVMLIKNIDETLVNGSIGKVTKFMDPGEARNEGLYEDDAEKPRPKPKAGQMWPVVAFNIPGGYIKEVMIVPEQFKVELPDGEVQASRTQLPLILSWAMSIHKSQGQTLDRVKVDLGRIFEKGQAYVALSRATSLEGLQVLNFNPAKVQAHPKVIEWSGKLKPVPL